MRPAGCNLRAAACAAACAAAKYAAGRSTQIAGAGRIVSMCAYAQSHLCSYTRSTQVKLLGISLRY